MKLLTFHSWQSLYMLLIGWLVMSSSLMMNLKMTVYSLIIFSGFGISVFLMTWFTTQALNLLLTLELASMTAIAAMVTCDNNISIVMILTLFTFLVCEASFGLALLVKTTRLKGNSSLKL